MHDDAWVIEHLPSLACPLLAIVGSQDNAFHQAGTRYLAEHVDSARLLVVSDPGHAVHRDQPDQVSTALQKLLVDL